MTTYNSYEEAKIANPDENIQHLDGKLFVSENSGVPYERRHDWLSANPAKYCMTVEKFLADGHKFVKSDVVFDFGDVVSIDTEFDVETYNKTDKMDDRRYILRAAALEEKDNIPSLHESYPNEDAFAGVKKPRTKVEYEQLGFHKCHEAMYKHEMEERLYGEICGEFKEASLTYISNNWESNLYRRIETPITERQEFIDFVESKCSELNANGEWSFACIAAELFDSGRVQLKDNE